MEDTPKKIIIGIAGPTAGGKTTIAAALAERCGAYRTRYSEILAEIAHKQNRSADKATLQQIYLEERRKRGEDFLAKLLEKKISGVSESVVVIEGNRRIVDIELLERLGNHPNTDLELLYIDASRDTRFGRYNERQVKEGKKPITWDEFMELESNAAENELSVIREIIGERGNILRTDDLRENELVEAALPLLNLQ